MMTWKIFILNIYKALNWKGAVCWKEGTSRDGP